MTDAEKWTLLCKWSSRYRVVIDWMPVRGAMPKVTLSLGTRAFVIGEILDDCVQKALDWVKDSANYYVYVQGEKDEKSIRVHVQGNRLAGS